jgi:Tfp pilus assembly protein PilO
MLILLLGWILYRTLITPKRKGINALKQNLKNIEYQIGNVLGEEVELRGGALEAEELEDHLKTLILKIPSERDIPDIINRFLTQVGKGLKIDYTLIQPKKLESEGRYKKLPIELEFTTSYAHFNTYLSQLNAMPEVFRIESMDMRRSPVQADQLHVHLLLSAFVMPGGVEEKAEAIAKEAYPEAPKVSPFKPKAIPVKPKAGPSQPLSPGATETEAPLTLQGIMQGDIKAAIINDSIVYVDDVIEGYRVLNIKENSVVLRKGRRTKILRLKY